MYQEPITFFDIFRASLAFVPLIFIFYIFRGGIHGFSYERKSVRERRRFYNENKDAVFSILSRFQYFENMPTALQIQFVKRLLLFLDNKNFFSRKMESLSFEQKVKISFPAIQITFGFNNFNLEYFKQIFIYPTQYLSANQKDYHQGEVNAKGAIVFSLDNFEKGYDTYHDGINLGLHEMAHALRVNSMKRRKDNILLNEKFKKFRADTTLVFMNLENEENSIIREYASLNFEEFFAVCVENFFERPRALKRVFPDLFDDLKELLNQDTTQTNPWANSRKVRQILLY